MRKLVIGLAIVGLNGALIYLVARGGSRVQLASVAAALAAFNLICGIRLGYNAAHAYIRDLGRLNRCLADQNESLVMTNRELLERFASPDADDVDEVASHPARSSA
jgi:hypothetical protein